MKKILALAATVLAGLTLAACSSTSSQSALDKIKEKGTLVVQLVQTMLHSSFRH